jgi:hypothetical protein
MATQIATKVQQLRNAHFDLGVQVTNEIDCGYGGKMQQFANANIYYHAVMGDAAHEVHGGIRTKYLSLGGHDMNPATGNRPLGFPLTDERNSDDSRCRVSRFEWGSIYWLNGGVVTYGNIYTEYLKAGGEKGRLGYPIADPVAVAGGLVSFFEHGLLYFGAKSQGQVIEMTYMFPQLGHPWMIASTGMPDKDVIKFSFYHALMNTSIAGHLLEELFNGRIFLKETARTIEMSLAFNFTKVKETPFLPNIDIYSCPIEVKGQLKNHQLYDIILKLPTRTHQVAPHSVYIKDSWHDFTFVHVTDTHVSRRLDGFRKFLRDKSMDDAVRNFNNFNDNFREFIQYANKLHRGGKLDFIMLTGDIVDYCFEDGGKGYYQNNYVHFESIVRGLTGTPDQVQNEELIVPLFTSLGNHDYRIHAYYPLFKVDIQWPASNKPMEQYGSMNLTKDEAGIVTRELLGINQMISSDRAIDMIKPDRENRGGNLNHYFRNICRDPSYVVQLGDHQVIMIDGKWDDGTIEGTWDAIVYYLGFRGEATDHFVGGSPDSIGFNGIEFDMVSRALQSNGLVIIGVHAPIINPRYSEYSWFLRESIRAANPVSYTNEMRKYLFRMDPHAFISFAPNRIIVNLTTTVHSGWSRTNKFWFHEGNGSDLLDYGVMRGRQENFAKMITGVQNSPRPADLILCGHVHKNWESRVIWDAGSQRMRFSHEFFTENPATYYHSYDTNVKADGSFTVPGQPGGANSILSNMLQTKQKRIHVEITDTAANNEQPAERASGVWWIKTKPYPYTLHAQPNIAHAKHWWLNVRPLLVQTSALGPSEWLRAPERQPDFRGCRLIAVQSDTITKITYVTNEAIKRDL